MAIVTLVMLLIYSTGYSLSEVIITPKGPLYIAVNTQISINCSAPNGVIYNWKATFTNGSTSIANVARLSPGVVILRSRFTDSSFIIVDTNDTSLISLECSATFEDMSSGDPVIISDIVNITIYGPPDSPENLSYVAFGDSLITSWISNIFEGINMEYHLSLLFYQPSKIQSQELNITNMISYNFTIEGLRSCDYFTFCVRGSNNAGLGNEYCINGSLLYIPTKDNIDYSLASTSENFTLTVIITIPATCLVSIQNLSYTIEVIGEQNESRRSNTIPANSKSYLQVNNLLENRSYSFRIESNNSNDEDHSVWIDFFTSDVQGIDICSINDNGFFTVSCDYVNGSNLPGCGYQLTGTNVTEFNGTIMKDDSHMEYIPDIIKYQNITITNIDSMVSFEKAFNSEVKSCGFTTDQTNSSTAATTNIPSYHNRISTVIIAVVIPVVSLILLLLSIAFVIYLCWKGYCFWPLNPLSKKVITAPAESNTQELNGKRPQDVLTSDKTQDTDIGTAGTYSSLQRLHTPHGANSKEKDSEAKYSELNSVEPLYHVLEKETPLVSEDISADPDAPAVPPFCPSGGDTPPVAEVQQTTSTTDDFMYAEIGNIRAKK